ncbi:hypothetical protein [uncultured Zoogloea sp.]|uniref:hypothetical protein n=1 Tax=uncultured Zoogloea sp. TaxID=160237 RepID=UPI00260FC04F|nr:hypothetical protein [uncultured Zoogloea sp.]
MHSITAPILLAGLLHDASRAHVIAAGDIATEFADLYVETQEALLSTATSLLAIVEPWCPATGSVPFADAVDWLAGHIHTAALANGPIHVPFESLSNKAQAFRRAQATHLLARFGFRDVPALGVRDGGDPARQSPPSA